MMLMVMMMMMMMMMLMTRTVLKIIKPSLHAAEAV